MNNIPYLNSVEIEGFIQTDRTELLDHQFRCNYSTETFYRESNCLVEFNPIHNGETVAVSYLHVGTVITAEDLNEIKAHIEDLTIHEAYVLPPATPISRGGFRPGEGLEMIGDILNVTTQGGSGDFVMPTASATTKGGVKIGNGLSMDGETLNCTVNGGLATIPAATNDSLGAVMPGATMSIEDGVIDYYLPSASSNTLGGIKIGDGLSIDSSGKLTIKLGDGLALDDDGKIKYVKPTSQSGWAYQDSGFDVIPAAPLIYVNETQFYQPELNARFSDMFDTPDGIMEFWIRCDLFLTSDFAYGDRFGFGYQNQNHTPDDYNYIATLWNGVSSSSDSGYTGYTMGCFIYSKTTWADSKFAKTNLLFDKGANNHILFHAVSHPTEGYLEVTINHGTYRAENRNVNDGNPFTNFFVYSNTERALFSNFIVSSTQIPYEDGGN